jgi:hypothetical protein
MKTTFLTLFTASALLAITQPVLADHHEGHGAGHGSGHGNELKVHLSESAQQDSKAYAERSLDLLQAGNQMIQEGNKSKNAQMMLQGAEILKKGLHMHHASMHGMKALMHQMKHEVMHAKVGDSKLSDKEVAELEATMKAMKEDHHKYMGVCHKEMAQVPDSAHLLIQMGSELIKKGAATKKADLLLQGTAMMEAGMALTHPHGMDKHEERVIERRVQHGGH